MKTHTITDKDLILLHKKVELMKSLVHYCGLKELGVYTSAGNQLVKLINELDQDIKNLSFPVAAKTPPSKEVRAA